MDLSRRSITHIVFPKQRIHLVEANRNCNGGDEAGEDRQRDELEEESQIQEPQNDPIQTDGQSHR